MFGPQASGMDMALPLSPLRMNITERKACCVLALWHSGHSGLRPAVFWLMVARTSKVCPHS